MRILLLSTYELGHQPFGLASPAAWLRARGHHVSCVDLSRDRVQVESVRESRLIGLYLPMHTATRLAIPVLERIRSLNASAHLCCFGLYASLNRDLLRELGVHTTLGGEFEQDLADLASRIEAGGAETPSGISLRRQQFLPPDRSMLPPLSSYARLSWNGQSRIVGYTESSRGCKHLCRHCPVVPVYNGAFRIVQRDVVLEDVRRQVAAGAEHITFGDPDFFNGPGHALVIVEALHDEFPRLTYDVTIKVEHLLQHPDRLPALQRTGCLFVTSAVESVDDSVLLKLAKGHTREDFVMAVRILREAGLTLSPTFVPFTPWTTWQGYRELLNTILALDLVEQVAPIQLAIRLLIPAGSRLLELPEIHERVGAFDRRALVYPWRHCDPSLDVFARELQELIKREDRKKTSRTHVFREIWQLAQGQDLPEDFHLISRAAIPYLTEPWYC